MTDPVYDDAVSGPFRLAVLMGHLTPEEALAAEKALKAVPHPQPRPQ